MISRPKPPRTVRTVPSGSPDIQALAAAGLGPVLRPDARVLVVKLADIGDALLATPALRLLRAAVPQGTVDVLTTPAARAAFAHSGLVDTIHVFDKQPWDEALSALRRPFAPLALGARLRREEYDAVIVLHMLVTAFGAWKHAGLALATGAPVRAGLQRRGLAGWRSAFLTHGTPDRGYDDAHVAQQMRDVVTTLVGPRLGETTSHALAFIPGERAEEAAAKIIAAPAPDGRLLDDRGLVAMHPGTGAFGPSRRWAPERFAIVADELTRMGMQVALVGLPADGTAHVQRAAKAPLFNWSGKTDLPTLAAVLRRCRLVIANDGGVGHLAAAMGTPVVSIFGPSSESAWRPWWPPDAPLPSPHRVVALDLPCRPCFYVGHTLGSRTGCPTRDCLAWLGTKGVVDAARSILEPTA